MLFEISNINDFGKLITTSDKSNIPLVLCVIDDKTDKTFIEHFKKHGKHTENIAVLINLKQMSNLKNILDIPKTPFVSVYRGWVQSSTWCP